MRQLFIHNKQDLYRILRKEVTEIPVAYIANRYDRSKYPDLVGLFDNRTMFLYRDNEDREVIIAFCFDNIGHDDNDDNDDKGLVRSDRTSKILESVVTEKFGENTEPIFSTIGYLELSHYIVRNAVDYLYCEYDIDLREYPLEHSYTSPDGMLVKVLISNENADRILKNVSTDGLGQLISWIFQYDFAI